MGTMAASRPPGGSPVTLVPTEGSARPQLDADEALRLAREFATDHLNYPAAECARRIREPQALRDGGRAISCFVLPVESKIGVPFLWIVLADARATAERVAERLVREHPIANIAVALCPSEGWTLLRYRAGREAVERSESLESLRYTAVLVFQPFRSPDTMTDSGPVQRPLTAQVEHLLFELHSDLRDVDGMHPDAALDELCKLLLTKSFDERHSAPRLQTYGTICDDEVAAIARAVYEEARTLLDTPEQGMRGAFAAPFLCSPHALARLVSRLAPFHLTSSAIDIKARAFQNVIGPAARAGMGQFFTPPEVIRFMVGVVAPRTGEAVADPFAGSAHFLTEAVRSSPSGSLQALGIEKSERMARVAYTDTLLSGAQAVRLTCADSLVPFGALKVVAPASMDVILTNPPFGSLLRDGALSHLGSFTIVADRTSAPLEVLGLERCVQILRPGGRLAIVLPDGIFANPGSRYVRDWIARETVVRAIVSLPVATFAPYGANVKTSILFARKRRPGEGLRGDEAVFMGSAEFVGYDASGKPTRTNDLNSIAAEARTFFEKEGW